MPSSPKLALTPEAVTVGAHSVAGHAQDDHGGAR